jgi:heme oxygenase
MTGAGSARLALRAATAAHHDRVDHVFSAATLSTRDGYGRFLLAQAGALFAVEDALDASRIETIVPDWPSRRRAELLRGDIIACGLAPPAPLPPPAFASDAAMLGGLYVLEGSRLGGTLLKRSVPADYPTAFLSGGNSFRWRRLLTIIDERLQTANDIDAAISAATGVFALFEHSGRAFLKAS